MTCKYCKETDETKLVMSTRMINGKAVTVDVCLCCRWREEYESEYGRSISAEVAAIAKESYNTLVNLNAANQVEPVVLRLPAGMFAVYNINTDSVRP